MTAILTCLILYGVGFFCFTFCDDQYKMDHNVRQEIQKQKWVIEKLKEEQKNKDIYYNN